MKNYIHGSEHTNQHSFVTIDDEADEIQGIEYDFVANVMSSFKNEEQKKWKLTRGINRVYQWLRSRICGNNR